LDLYNSGIRSEKVAGVFDVLKRQLPPLIQQTVEKQRHEKLPSYQGHYPIAAQKALGLVLMEKLGFDLKHGRLDVSHHPFCGGVSEDVRITTRYDETDFTQSLMGVLHETGQGAPRLE
jgi:carboxypeptidase Taq